MKVTISVKGRFHAFNLARELQARGHLHRLITTYPTFEAGKYGIERNKIRSHPVLEVIDRAYRRLPGWMRSKYNGQYVMAELVDIAAVPSIPRDADIFVGWSSFSLHAIARAKSYGARTVVERGSSHIAFQRDLLREEYDRHGIAGESPHPAVVDKELMEYEAADFIAVPSEFVRQTFLERGMPPEKLLHLPYGVSLDDFHPQPKADQVFRIIHCGAISVRKGIPYLLQAFSELDLPNAELRLIGNVTDEIKPWLGRYSRREVVWAGPFPQKELYRHYSQGSVFCLASIEEGLAMVLAQAMACGLPVICTHNSGGADIVRDGIDGFVVPIRDVAALKEKIVQLYEDHVARETMGASARQRVHQGFSWSNYGDRVVAEYNRIMSGGRAPVP